MKTFTSAFNILILGTGLLAASYSQAQQNKQTPTGWLWGVGLGYKQQIYQGVDNKFTPIPFIGYKGERLNVFGPFVSYDLVQTDNLKFALKAQPRMDDYESSDSEALKGMDDRDISLDLGASLQWELGDFSIKTEALADVLNKSDGHEVSVDFAYSFNYGPLFFKPSIGLVYQDDKLVDYYYGVENHEALSTRPAYEGNSSVNQTLGLSIFTPILWGGITRLNLKYTAYANNISNSPIVSDDNQVEMFLMYSKFFE